MATFDTVCEEWSAVTDTPFSGRAYHTATLVGTKIWVVRAPDPAHARYWSEVKECSCARLQNLRYALGLERSGWCEPWILLPLKLNALKLSPCGRSLSWNMHVLDTDTR